MNWLNPQHYSLPVLVSVLLHGLVAAALLWHWPEPQRMPEPVPQHVIAQVIQEENAAEKQRKLAAEKRKRQQELAARRAAEQKKKQAEQKRREQEAARKLAEQKKREQALALKEKAAAEQRAKEKAAQEKADRQRAEQQRQQEQALAEQLAREQAAQQQKEQQEARRQAERAAVLEADFIEQIRAKVSSVWRYPPSVRPDQEVSVRIQLVPTGEVIQVQVVRSSGHAALDRSVEQAVMRASPLPVPDDIRLFEQRFRNLTLKFRPENATW
ncbi:cell envelope integrity protein TolA [Venatoribacter cucullus]|uniref:cell envelope integrity protein TolA n=1 Tax=Venatoribacter cucullus TaxID=2661630 RepID=UPI00223EBA8C|nr:cell envelope integrity protein TolA [Venatoribacter cucullus]UZK03318.1 cell envelope integrity protein TolA [Venatoribacter cucullus]